MPYFSVKDAFQLFFCDAISVFPNIFYFAAPSLCNEDIWWHPIGGVIQWFSTFGSRRHTKHSNALFGDPFTIIILL